MRSIHGIIFLTAIAVTSSACAQTDPAALEQLLKGKQFHLRNYSADSVTRYTWAGGTADGGLTASAPHLRTFGIFIPASVKLKKQTLTIAGEASTLVRDAPTQKIGLSGHSKLSLVIDLGSAAPAEVLPHLQEQLFFPDAASALDGLPKSVTDKIPLTVNAPPPVKPTVPQPNRCKDGILFYLNGTDRTKAPCGDPGFEQARLIPGAGDPQFTAEARQAGLTDGTVTIWFVVDPTGKPTDLWVARSLGFGLDEAAAASLRTYRFTPAQYKDKPVSVVLMMEIRFQWF